MAETLSIHKIPSVLDEVQRMQDRIMRRALDIFHESGDIFGRDLDNWLQAEREVTWRPAIELREKDDQFRLQVAVPGVEPKDIDIEVTPEDIVVKAGLSHRHKEEKGNVHICEFEAGNLFRSIRLPKRINPDKVKAEYRNGLLNVTAEIAQEARVKRIKPEAA